MISSLLIMISSQAVANILGLRRPIVTLAELREAIAQGLPKAALGHVVDYIVLDPHEALDLKNRLVPPATYKRRTHRLKLEESERIERLARIMAIAEDTIGNTEGARHFMLSSHPELDAQRPLDVAQTELGARHVEEVLARAAHGLPL